MIVYDSHRQRLSLGECVGRGGEAEIYEARELSGWLAKIYSGPLRPAYPRKLAWMLDHPPDDPTLARGHASLAWPVDLLFDERGRLVGYLMPQIRNAVPLLEVFNPRRRAQVLPEFDWLYLHRAARNLAAALGAIHARNYVVGDLNESNVLVTPGALITLIDTDSFQVRETKNGRSVMTHPCPVAKPEYTPPELQGRPLERSFRLPEHDLFGLGVLVFQLLMDGSHPFRAQWLRAGDPPPLGERIRRGCFPYIESPPCPVAPPPGAPGLDLLHPGLARLVRRCFTAGIRDPKQRPAPETWAQALAEAEKVLVLCPNEHYYSGHQKRCPYCAVAPGRVQVSLPPAGVLLKRLGNRSAPAGPSRPVRLLQPAGPGPAVAVPTLARPPTAQPGRPAPGVRAEVLEVLRVGVGIGGLAGALLGALVAGIPLALGYPAEWQLIWACGAAAGGLGRGWRLGLGIGKGVGGRFGWNRAWQAFGALAGAAGLGWLAWSLSGSLALAAVAVLAGVMLGQFLGLQLWALGDRLGWEQIWTVIGALAGAWLGWVLGDMVGGTWFGDFSGALAVSLVGRSVGQGLAWALVGAAGGAAGGALAGVGVELVSRLLGVSN
jgi:hypothetical protein